GAGRPAATACPPGLAPAGGERRGALAPGGAGAHRVEPHVLPADLTASGAVAALVAEIERRELTVGWLVNNAGFGTVGRFHTMPVERELNEIMLNVEALVELTGRLVPAM